MRPDKAAALRKRLLRGDSMDFSALLQGVSTLDEQPDAPDVSAAEPPAAVTSDAAVPAVAAETAETAAALPLEDPEPADTSVPEPAESGPDGGDIDVVARRMRTALTGLQDSLGREAGRMAAALSAGDADEAGLRLAQVNQLLSLIAALDGTGELARQIGLAGAPPPGRRWFRPVWTLAEFAESPLSGLLPRDASDLLVRDVLDAAWAYGMDPQTA